MYDVVVVGGGPAGLNASLQLGRARRSVVVSDGQVPRNPGHGVHGFLTRDGIRPDELRAAGRREIAAYPGVEFRDTSAVAAGGLDGGTYAVQFADGSEARARKVLLASGVTDQLPAIEGLAGIWGVRAFNCPYCSAWEVRDQPLSVIGSDDMAAMMATHLTQWSPRVYLCANGDAEISQELQMMLQAHDIDVIEEPVERIEETGTGVRIHGRSPITVASVFLHPAVRQRSDLAQQLGCTLQDDGTVQVDDFGQTGVPGVYAAGDMSRKPSMPLPSMHVVNAASNGSMAAVAMDQEIATEDAQARMLDRLKA